MSQGSLFPKIRFLDQKLCSVAREQTDRQTWKWINCKEDTLSDIQEFLLQPVIKDRSKKKGYMLWDLSDLYIHGFNVVLT